MNSHPNAQSPELARTFVQSPTPHPFFHQGVKVVDLGVRETYRIRLLPAFDFRISPDTNGFQCSFVPYRDWESSGDYGQSPFTEWYRIVCGYKYFGRTERHFLSPLTNVDALIEGIDPLYDIIQEIQRNPSYTYLRNWRGKHGYPLIRGLRQFGFLNGLIPDEQGRIDNHVVVCTQTALENLRRRLNLLDESESPDSYHHGDPTCPIEGWWFAASRATIGNGERETVCFDLADQGGCHELPSIDPTTDDGITWLGGRYDIFADDRVVRIPTPAEILEILVDDGLLPHDLIRNVCDDRWEIPPKRLRPVYTFP